MLQIGIIFTLLTGYVIEIFILDRIFTHPAAGNEMATRLSLLVNYGAIVILPFFVTFFLFLKACHCNKDLIVIFRLATAVSATGAVISVIALRQYSHATPGIMFTGYFLQWILIVASVMRSNKSGSESN